MRKLKIGLIACLACLALACCVALAACQPEANKQTYKLNWQPDEHVTVVAEGYDTLPAELEEGTEVTFTATPDSGWEISSVTPVTIKKEGEKYKFTVERDITIKVIAKEKVEKIEVDKPATLVYYAGQQIDPEDYTVTVYYETNRHEETDAYTVAYQNGDAFALGDTKFEIKFGGKTEEITLDKAVEGKITLKLDGGVLAEDNDLKDLPGYTYDATASTVSWTFASALEEDVVLPEPSKTVNEVPFDFIRWSGVEKNTIAKDTDTSVTVTALYEVRLVEVDKLEFTTKEVTETVKVTEDGEEKDKEVTVNVPYLVITGKFLGATEAYLFLFEGNKPVTSLNGPTVKKGATADFTLEFDLRDFVNAEVDQIGDNGEPNGEKTHLKGKWMDIKFCAKLGDRTETQEINLNNYAEDFINISATLEAKVGETWWQFAYKVHTPNAGDKIHGTDGAVYEGNEKLLKLVYQDCPPVNVENVTLVVKDRDVTTTPESGDPVTTKVPTAYIVVTGNVIQASNKAEAEELLGAFEFTVQANSTWEYPTVTKAYKVNDDLSYELTLSLENLVEGKGYYMHFGGNNFAAEANDTDVLVGYSLYTLNNHKAGDWTNGLVWLTMKDVSVPEVTITNAKFEKATVNLGTADEPQETEVAMLVFTGTWTTLGGATLTAEQATANFSANRQYAVQSGWHFANQSWDYLNGAQDNRDSTALITFTEDGTVTIKLLVNGAVEGRGYYVHLIGGNCKTAGIEVDDTAVTVDGRTYAFFDTSSMAALKEAGMTSEDQTWYQGLLMFNVKQVATDSGETEGNDTPAE